METHNNSGGEGKPAFLRFGMIALFAAAVSPVPDDPVVIPLGLMRYSPLKFFSSYFAGKLIVTTAGAYLGQSLGLTIEEYLWETAAIVISLVLTVLVTVVLPKWKTILKKMNRPSLSKGQ